MPLRPSSPPPAEPATPTLVTTLDSPIGPLTLTWSGSSLTGLHMQDQAHAPRGQCEWVDDPRPFVDVIRQLEGYFAGELMAFDIPLSLRGTPFQRRVWAALMAIPYGETCSYAQLAAAVGNPGAARAVGLANGRNPVALIVPCHRVIAADGTLGGYGGGLDRKSWLLGHEKSVLGCARAGT